MPFTAIRDDELSFLRDQANLPDRAVGLIYPILIERRLRSVLESRWQNNSKESLLRDLFREGGALGSLKTRVQIGFVVGFYDEVIYLDLLQVVDIRNSFAHQPCAHEFCDQPICDHVSNLKLPDKFPKFPTSCPEQHDKDWKYNFLRASRLQDEAPPRHRFLRTVEIILTWLSIEAGELGPPPVRQAGQTLASLQPNTSSLHWPST